MPFRAFLNELFRGITISTMIQYYFNIKDMFWIGFIYVDLFD